MAFLQSLKRALGFDGEADDETEGIDATVHPLSMRRDHDNGTAQHTDTKPAVEPANAEEPAAPTHDDAMKVKIFERVVEIFNESLPQFVKSTVDPEAQRRYLFDALDKSMKDYLNQLESNAQSRQRDSWMRDRQRIEGETRDLRERLKEAQEKAAEWSKQQLSNDRQLRTQKERIHDLEAQIANLEGEKEQFELEKRSLVNKLRVCSVQASDEDVDLATKLNEITEKYKIAETMISDLTAEASKAKAKAAEILPQLDEKQHQLDEKQHQLDEANKQLDDVKKQLDEAHTQLAEAEEGMNMLEELEKAVEKFEEVKAAKDKQINALKHTIEANLDSQAKIEGELKAQIKQLQEEAARRPSVPLEDIPEEPVAEAPAPKNKRKRKPRVTAIDDSIDDTDWLVSTPEPGKTIMAEPDPEFGYQPPQRKPTPTSDSQLSLW